LSFRYSWQVWIKKW